MYIGELIDEKIKEGFGIYKYINGEYYDGYFFNLVNFIRKMYFFKGNGWKMKFMGMEIISLQVGKCMKVNSIMEKKKVLEF